jgi:hypothetical protein
LSSLSRIGTPTPTCCPRLQAHFNVKVNKLKHRHALKSKMRRQTAWAALQWAVLWHCWLLLLGSGASGQVVNQTTIFKALLRQEVSLTQLKQSVVDARRELASAAAPTLIAFRHSASECFLMREHSSCMAAMPAAGYESLH